MIGRIGTAVVLVGILILTQEENPASSSNATQASRDGVIVGAIVARLSAMKRELAEARASKGRPREEAL
jgi:hypothetical protein